MTLQELADKGVFTKEALAADKRAMISNINAGVDPHMGCVAWINNRDKYIDELGFAPTLKDLLSVNVNTIAGIDYIDNKPINTAARLAKQAADLLVRLGPGFTLSQIIDALTPPDVDKDPHDMGTINDVSEQVLDACGVEYNYAKSKYRKRCVDAHGTVTYVDLSPDTFATEALVHAGVFAVQSGSPYSPKLVLDNIQRIQNERRIKDIQDLQQELHYDPRYIDFADSYLRQEYAYMQINEPIDCFLTVRKQWLGMIKRSLYSLGWGNWYNICLAYKGRQGIGKSMYFKKTLEPLFRTMLNMSATMTDICDERSADMLQNTFVTILEELSVNDQIERAGTQATQAAAQLKKVLTSQRLTRRRLGTHVQDEIEIKTVFASVANVDLNDVVMDQTGMRRFFQLTSLATEPWYVKNPEMAAKLQDADKVIGLFRGIDENLPQGYWYPGCDTWDEIAAIQDTYIRHSDAWEYLQEHWAPDPEGAVKLADMHADYLQWRKKGGEDKSFPLALNRGFPREALALYGDDVRVHVNGQSRYRLKRIKETASLPVWTPGLGAPKAPATPLPISFQDFTNPATTKPLPPPKTVAQAQAQVVTTTPEAGRPPVPDLSNTPVSDLAVPGHAFDDIPINLLPADLRIDPRFSQGF
jgi:hypothetical protein